MSQCHSFLLGSILDLVSCSEILVKIDSPLPLMVFDTCCLLILSFSLFFAFLLPEPVFTGTALALRQCWVLATFLHP